MWRNILLLWNALTEAEKLIAARGIVVLAVMIGGTILHIINGPPDPRWSVMIWALFVPLWMWAEDVRTAPNNDQAVAVVLSACLLPVLGLSFALKL